MPDSTFHWADKKVLITGATGTLGLSLIRYAQGSGAMLFALSRGGGPVPGADSSFACDLTDANAVIDSFRQARFDVIVHLAAQSQDTDLDPKSTFDTNLVGTLNLLEAARCHAPAAPIVIASTSAVTCGPEPLQRPGNDGYAVRPYQASKLCAEVIAGCYRSSYDLKVAIARLPNLFGPHDRNLRRLVPGTICAVLEDRSPDIRSDPLTLIDLLYVDDASAAILRLAEGIAIGPLHGTTVSVSSRESVQIRDVVAAILEQMGRLDLLPEMATRGTPSSTGKRLPFVASMEAWQWKPQIPLQEGLRRTIEWYRQSYRE